MIPHKSTGTAYLLWFFLGAFGGHQFYLGKTGRAVSYLLTFGWLTVGVWIDLFTLPAQVRQTNQALSLQALVNRAPESSTTVIVNNGPDVEPEVDAENV